MTLQTAFIGLGSNLGDGRAALQEAWQLLGQEEGVELATLSFPYVSAPVGMESDNWFTNAVGRVETSIAPERLLAVLLDVEQRCGRRRDANAVGYQDRTLDLDLLYYADLIVESPALTLPHPWLHERLFVLLPLVEVADTLQDPRDGETSAQKLAVLQKQIADGVIPPQQILRESWG